MTDVWLNDRPIEEYGVTVSNLNGWWNPVAQRIPASPIPGRRGNRTTDRGMNSAPRRIPLVVNLTASSLSDRLTKLDALAQDLSGLVEFRVSDEPEKVAYATLEAGSIEFRSPQLTYPSVVPAYELVFENPTKYDRRRQLLVVPGSGGAKAVPCGTAPHKGVLWVMDTANSRTVDVLHSNGTLLYRMRLTGTLASGEYLEIDMDRDNPTIMRVTSAGASKISAFSWLDPADRMPVFDPQDRPRILHSGTGDLVLSYRRAYQV